MFLLENFLQLLRAPGRVFPPLFKYDFLHHLRRFVRTFVRSTTLVDYPRQTFRLESVNPFIPGFPTDAELLAKGLEVLHLGLRQHHKLHPCFHN